MKHLFILVLFFLVSPSLAFALSCPNKPSNAVTLATVHFNTNDGEGQMWEIYPGAGQIQSPAGAEGTATASILPAGSGTGGQQTIWPKSGSQQPLNNLYVCFRWKINAQFTGLTGNNKLLFVAAQDWSYGKKIFNGLLNVPKRDVYPPFPGSSLQMTWGHNSNTAHYDNSHACAYDFGLTCFPNVSDTPILADTWYTVEHYIIASSSNTSRNGTVKWWINGVLQGNYTNLNVGDGIINEVQINHAWDGSIGVQCGPPTNPSNTLGRDCRYDSIHYFDELLIASVGGLTPPPSAPSPPSSDNPVGAPSQPINLQAM